MTAVAALGVSTAAVAAPLLSAPTAAAAQELPVWAAAGLALPAPAEPARTVEGAGVSLDAADTEQAVLPADDLAELPALTPYSIGSAQIPAPAPPPPAAPAPDGPPAPAVGPAEADAAAAPSTAPPSTAPPSTPPPSTPPPTAPPSATAGQGAENESGSDETAVIDLPEPQPSPTSIRRTPTPDPSDADRTDNERTDNERPDSEHPDDDAGQRVDRSTSPSRSAAPSGTNAPQPGSVSPSRPASTRNDRPETTPPRPAPEPSASRPAAPRTPRPSDAGSRRNDRPHTTTSPPSTSPPSTSRTTSSRTTTPEPANDTRRLRAPRCTAGEDVRTDVRTGPAGNMIGVRVSGLSDDCAGQVVRLLVDTESGDEITVSATAEDGNAEFTLPDPIPPGEVADIRLEVS